MGERIIKAAADLEVGDMVRGPFGGPVRVNDIYMVAEAGRDEMLIRVSGAGTFQVPPFVAVVVVDG